MATTEHLRMSALPEPSPLVADLASALFLDVDGTLLDFANDPDAVRVEPGLLRTLDTLHERLGGALALVSGRSIDGLDRLFGRPRWAAAGLHGLERRRADGAIERLPVDPARIAALRAAALRVAGALPGVRIEDKGACIALHCREAPHQEDALGHAAATLVSGFPDFELQRGSHVYELKPLGMDKGKAVTDLLTTAPFVDRIPVYVGDDLTDEHAFGAVNAHGGISIRVGSRVPTDAYFTLSSPAAVHAWLDSAIAAPPQGITRHAGSDEPIPGKP
jgi:trehalose 6-phosphate phosphatase